MSINENSTFGSWMWSKLLNRTLLNLLQEWKFKVDHIVPFGSMCGAP